MRKAMSKAMLFYFLTIICFILGGATLIVTAMSYTVGHGYLFGLFSKQTVITVGIVALTVFVCLGLLFNLLRNKEREKYEYDEFGVKKGLDMYNLSSDERRQLEIEKMAQMERIIPRGTFEKIVEKGTKNPDEELKGLTGLGGVKDEIEKLRARIIFEKKEKKNRKGFEVGHILFYGAPGTGKTTVARIITGILYEEGIIKENKIVEIDGNFLKSGDAEDTAIKTKAVIRKAYDGVLFIDEAYALSQSNDKQGKNAIATLIKEMEDNRDKFICILAGYKGEMKNLLDVNPGFRSRIKTYIEFPDYTETDLRDIAMNMANKQGYVISAEGMDAILIRLAKEKELKTWGNARTVRNVLDESINNHAVRIVREKDKDKFTITGEDINKKCVNTL